jgi:hypothetical protein
MPPSHSDTAILSLEKSFPYRGGREHFLNEYHLDQVPLDSTVWNSLGSAAWSFEANVFPSSVQLERIIGHNPGTPPVLVYESDVAPPGEGGISGSFTPIATEHECPGDDAVWVRYGTTQKTSRGKPIYLRNYYHAVFYDATPDTLSARQKTALDALGAAWVAGINVSGTTFRRAGPRGAVAQNHQTAQFITTRTLKRRGRRKKPLTVGTATDTPVIVDFGSLWKIISGLPR